MLMEQGYEGDLTAGSRLIMWQGRPMAVRNCRSALDASVNNERVVGLQIVEGRM